MENYTYTLAAGEKKEEPKTSRVGKRYLPWNPKSIARTQKNIKDWNRALNMARMGEDPVNWPLQLLYTEVSIDATLTSQINNRKNQVFSSSFSLRKPDGEVDEEQTAVLRKHPIYRALTDAVMDSVYYGYNLVELSQIVQNGNRTIKTEVIPRYNVVPQIGRFYPDYTDLTKWTAYREMPEFGTWILEFNSGDIGLMNKVVPHVLFKRFAQACWSELCEIYGIPPRVMKTNTQDPGMLNRAEKMMRDMGSAAWFIIDETEEFEFAKGASGNGDVYKNLISLCRDEICLAVSGAILGQDTENGSRSKDEVAFEVLWLLVQSDMALLEDAWNNTIIPALVKHGVLKGQLTFEYDPAEDTGQLWNFVQGLMPYYEIPPDFIEDKFGIEVTAPKQRGGMLEETLALLQGGGNGFFPQALESRACGSHLTLALPKDAPGPESLIQKVAESKGQLRFDAETYRATAKTLGKGLNKGLGGNKIQLAATFAYGADDPHLLASYEMNLFRFSAGKTLAEVQALNEAFRKAKNFDIFQTNANQIGDVFSKRWLTTEYDTAVLVGESAANYHSLRKDVEKFPYWEYVTVGDHAVRPEHAKLDGLILPANDPAWQRIFPPNGWNCRCHVVARTRAEVEGVDFADMESKVNDYYGSEEFDRNVSQGFAANRAESGEVFAANQQYITGKNLTQTNKAINEISPEDYGLQAIAEARAKAKTNLPQMQGSPGEKVSSLDTLNGQTVVKDYQSRALAVDTGDLLNSDLLEALTDALSSPDEVWAKIKGKAYQVNYIRYYLDQIFLVSGSLENKQYALSSFRKLSEKQAAKYRAGMLIKQ